MKKRLVVALVIVGAMIAAAMLCPQAASAKELKLGYVDLAKVVDEYTKTKDSEKALEEKGKAKEAERKKLVDELRKMKDEQALLSEKGKAEKQPAIDAKVKDLQAFDGAAREELLKLRNELFGDILKDVEKVITEYAKAEGYDLLLNSRTLLYGAEQMDLTAEVLKRLNKK